MKSAREDIEVSRGSQVVLWEAVNEYAAAVAAEADVPPLTVRRMDAVTKVHEAVVSCIEADRASRGTGEREAFLSWRGVDIPCDRCGGAGVRAYPSSAGWRGGAAGQSITTDVCDSCWGSGDKNRHGANLRKLTAAAPAEPPTGHLEVAVRALEEIQDKRLNKYGDCEGCCRSNQELFVGGHDAYFVCGIASRALAAIRADPAGECRRFHCGHTESEHGQACSAPGCRCKSFLAAAPASAGDAGTGACEYCGRPRDNWRHKPSVVFDGKPAHEFEPASTPTTATKGEP